MTKTQIALETVTAAIANGERPKVTIATLMEQLGMSQAGASTYFYNAKRQLAKAVAAATPTPEQIAQMKRDARNARRRELRAAAKQAA